MSDIFLTYRSNIYANYRSLVHKWLACEAKPGCQGRGLYGHWSTRKKESCEVENCKVEFVPDKVTEAGFSLILYIFKDTI